MTFTALDVILLVIIFFFAGCGYASGIVKTLGGVLGLAVGVYIAGLSYQVVGSWLSPLFMGANNWALIVAFVLIFIIVDRLVALLFGLLDKAYDLLSFIPLAQTFSRLLGAAFGLLEGALIGGLLVFVLARFPINTWLGEQIVSSGIAAWCSAVANLVIWLIPEAMRRLKSII